MVVYIDENNHDQDVCFVFRSMLTIIPLMVISMTLSKVIFFDFKCGMAPTLNTPPTDLNLDLSLNRNNPKTRGSSPASTYGGW